MIRNHSKTLWVTAKRSVVSQNAVVTSAAFRLLSSAQPLPSEEYDDETPWKPRRYQRATSPQYTTPKIREKVRFQFPSKMPSYRQNILPVVQNECALPQEMKNEPNVQEEAGTSYVSPRFLAYAGEDEMPITSTLHIVKPREDIPRGIWPVFRLMDQDGCFRNPALDGKNNIRPASLPMITVDNKRDLESLRKHLSEVEAPFQTSEIEACGLLRPSATDFPDIESDNTLWRAYRQIVRLREMDNVLLNAQRQGRISFYMTCTGEEATLIGTSSALEAEDHVLAQYREQGVLMWRGFSLDQFFNQCFSNDLDLGKGRQMPVHYGSRALNYHTISSPLGTQLPQAVGVAYRLKMTGKPNVAIAFFGEGGSSTPDFHSAMNFAAVLKAPCIFFCRNNGYAISTPAKEQYAGDGIVSRAPGYGVAAIRVDGNDVFAVHAAVRAARKYALEHSAPVLIEAITYRMGHHSTSDDSSAYRDVQEVQNVKVNSDPLHRLEMFLKKHNWLNDDEIQVVQKDERKAVLNAFQKAEKRPKPAVDTMFEDVYCEMPPHLRAQKAQLEEHIAKYPQHYN